MKQLILSFITLAFFACAKESKEKPTIKTTTSITEKSIDNDIPETEENSNDTIKKTDLGYADKYEKLPKLIVDTISETEFYKLKPQEFLQKIKPREQGNFFFIDAQDKEYKFKKYKDYGGEESYNGYELLGFYNHLQLYALTNNATSENMGFGELFLFDTTNDFKYNLISFGDASVELPIPSPNNKYLVYYYNSVYETQNCNIGVLKINDTADFRKRITEAASYNSNEFKIEKIIWKTNQIFLIKGYKEIENQNIYSYYKAEIK